MNDQGTASADPIVVTIGVCGECNSVHTAQVYHRDYPEVRAEGESPERAAAGLIGRLGRALDAAPDPWRGESVRAAIADVGAFVARDGAGNGRSEEDGHGDSPCELG